MQTRTLEHSPIFLHQLLNTIYARQIQTCPKKENIYLMLTHQLLNYTDRKNILIYSIYNNIYTSISCRDKVFFVLKRIPAWSIKKKITVSEEFKYDQWRTRRKSKKKKNCQVKLGTRPMLNNFFSADGGTCSWTVP